MYNSVRRLNRKRSYTIETQRPSSIYYQLSIQNLFLLSWQKVVGLTADIKLGRDNVSKQTKRSSC